mgnify:CR=1 FL=1|jgi:hypothetical protein|tara:strand:- start:162 stop:365 length:204 start_codon:yes stop_codon:yes gene_type:complete
MDIPAELVATVSLVVGSIVWLIRLEGRVNTHEAICAERYQQLRQQHVEGLDEMRLIETKLDSLIQRL